MDKSRNRFQRIKEHFEKEAVVFDRLFFKIMPRYQEMMEAVVDAFPFHKSDRLKIIDLGCGTGNLSQKLLAAHPNARITCVDMAENMLQMAGVKLASAGNVGFWHGDMRDYVYPSKCDAIVASMALHHIDAKDKPGFYRRLYRALSREGVFFGIDIFVSSSSHLQKLYMDKWKAFMRTNGLPPKKTNEMIARHQREDRPVCIEAELAMLRGAGFRYVDVLLKHYNFAAYGGIK